MFIIYYVCNHMPKVSTNPMGGTSLFSRSKVIKCNFVKKNAFLKKGLKELQIIHSLSPENPNSFKGHLESV